MVLILRSNGLIYIIKTAQCLVNEKSVTAHIYMVQYSQNYAWSGQGAVTSDFSFKTAQCPVSEACGSIYLASYPKFYMVLTIKSNDTVYSLKIM